MTDLSVELFPSLPGLRSRHWRIECYASEAPMSSRGALMQALPHVPKESWADRFAWGGLYLNGRRLKDLNQELSLPWRIDYYEALYDVRTPEKEFPRLATNAIVYNHDGLIIAYKPAGLPCLPGCEQQHFHLAQSLKDLGFGPKLHFASRLDAAAQGLVPVAASPHMVRALQRMYERHTISKSYTLLVSGRPAWGGVCVTAPIDRSPDHSILRVVSPSGKKALTEFKFVRAVDDTMSVIEARPITGRTHQLRVHCQLLGLPIVGDGFYGGLPAKELGLICSKLVLPVPGMADPLEIVAPGELIPPWAAPETLWQVNP